MLAGCSWSADSLWPTLSDSEPGGGNAEIVIPASEAERNLDPLFDPVNPATGPRAAAGTPPVLGNTNFTPMQPAPASPTGTVVGQHVVQLRGELAALEVRVRENNTRLQQLRAATAGNAQRYHGTVAAITARLQLGTTPGNPVVVNQWNAAQADLDRLSSDIGAMNGLSNSVAENVGTAEFLLDTAHATFGLSGAIDEDHRQLEILEDELNRSLVLIQRLLSELQEDISRQTAYVANERARLSTLSQAIASGEIYGETLASRALSTPSGGRATGYERTSSNVAPGGRPLVVIRFDRPDVAYEQALYSALTRALERRPDARFDVVAVAPTGGSASDMRQGQIQSRRNAEAVMASISGMGLPANRLRLSSTTSADVASSEIHIYVR